MVEITGYDNKNRTSMNALRFATITQSGDKNYLDVRAVVVGSTPNTEDFRGSDLSGSDLTLSNTTTTSSEDVYINGVRQVATVDYTISHNTTSSVITFTGSIDSGAYITVRYFT